MRRREFIALLGSATAVWPFAARTEQAGNAERAGQIASEFVRLKVNVILTSGDAQGLAAKQATTTIPIVIAIMGEPVGSGLVASLARPGGNVTGLSILQAETAGKRSPARPGGAAGEKGNQNVRRRRESRSRHPRA
jgi:hypothetical protein